MATLVKEIYQAFIEAGVSKETANRVADSLDKSVELFVRKDDNSTATKSDVSLVREDITRLDKRISVLEAELKNIKWIIAGVGFPLTVGIIATVIGVFFK